MRKLPSLPDEAKEEERGIGPDLEAVVVRTNAEKMVKRIIVGQENSK
jgi:hypothetical protein